VVSYCERGAKDNPWMESFWAHFKGENVSLFLEAATFEELEWVIGKQIWYYNHERRHSRLGYRPPLEYLVTEGFIPETLAETGAKKGSAFGAQVQLVFMLRMASTNKKLVHLQGNLHFPPSSKLRGYPTEVFL